MDDGAERGARARGNILDGVSTGREASAQDLPGAVGDDNAGAVRCDSLGAVSGGAQAKSHGRDKNPRLRNSRIHKRTRFHAGF